MAGNHQNQRLKPNKRSGIRCLRIGWSSSISARRHAGSLRFSSASSQWPPPFAVETLRLMQILRRKPSRHGLRLLAKAAAALAQDLSCAKDERAIWQWTSGSLTFVSGAHIGASHGLAKRWILVSNRTARRSASLLPAVLRWNAATDAERQKELYGRHVQTGSAGGRSRCEMVERGRTEAAQIDPRKRSDCDEIRRRALIMDTVRRNRGRSNSVDESRKFSN